MKTKPCPFCIVLEDTGGACCFCDYHGEVSIGYGGHFDSVEQYDKIANAKTHQEAMDELHGRNDNEKIHEIT